MKIGNKKIGLKHKPFIIAEFSGNHNQSLKILKKMVLAAARAGVDAIKLQTYTPDTMTLNLNKKEFRINEKGSLWKGFTLYDLYKKAYTPWKWHKEIFNLAKSKKLIAFSSVFDQTSVDFLEKLNVPAYKISSFENTDIPLIRKVAKTGKPLIISTGIANLDEINESVREAKKFGCKKLVLLKCTSAYPAHPKSLNLSTLNYLKKKFKCEVGISDHTNSIGASISSVVHGATVIEKHFKLSGIKDTVDDEFSIDDKQLKLMTSEIKNAWLAIGKIQTNPSKFERDEKFYKRSLYCSRDIEKGEKFTSHNLKLIRPGLGLKPKFFIKLIGKKAKKKIKMGTPISMSHFKL